MHWRDLFRVDTYMNLLSGVGAPGKDRRRATTIDVDPVTEDEARIMWKQDFLSRACIERLPDTAFRDGGFNIGIQGGGGKKLAEDINTKLEELDAVPQLVQAAKWERAYGGAALFPVLIESVGAANNKDRSFLAQPLDESKILQCTAVHCLEPRELQVATWYDDILRPRWRKPRTYTLSPVATVGNAERIEIHESRLIIFPGTVISNDRTVSERAGWGENALTVAKQILADFGIALGGISGALDKFSQDVLALEGLSEMLALDGGKLAQQRLVLMDQVKSALRTLVISSGDKYERQDISFAGVEPTMGLLFYVVAAALEIPVALLFGMEPAGMNATGAFDIRSYYDRVGDKRTSKYKTPTEKLIRLTSMLPKDGPCKGKEPEQWSLEWKALWQQTDKEREESRKMRTDNDIALIDAGIATVDEIRAQRFGGDTYSYELHLVGAAPVKEMPPAHVSALEAKYAGKPRSLEGMSEAELKALLEAPDDEPPEEDDDDEEGAKEVA